jgi:hypothetical protein
MTTARNCSWNHIAKVFGEYFFCSFILQFPLGSPFAHLFKKSETVVLGYQGLGSNLILLMFVCHDYFAVDWDDEEDNEEAKKSLTKLGGHRG